MYHRSLPIKIDTLARCQQWTGTHVAAEELTVETKVEGIKWRAPTASRLVNSSEVAELLSNSDPVASSV
jgi:hypothetical protein